MIKPVNIPRGTAILFSIGLVAYDVYTEATQYRPDQILEKNGISGIKNEVLDNYMSICSPISAVKGKRELFVSDLFRSYFEV